jgi:hypothetical protein
MFYTTKLKFKYVRVPRLGLTIVVRLALHDSPSAAPLLDIWGI